MAILKLRRGTTSQLGAITLESSEPFYDSDLDTIVVGKDGLGNNVIISKLDESNSGSLYLLGDVTASNIIINDLTGSVPTSDSSSGQLGAIKADSNYLYVCYASSSWGRIALDTNF